jgi:hypothetical protein
MTILLLLSALAFAEEPTDTADATDTAEPVVPETEGIVQFPVGTEVQLPQPEGLPPFSVWRTQQHGYFMPEDYYKSALAKSKKLDVCLPALDSATETGLQWMSKASESQQACLDQFDTDEVLIGEQVQTIATQEVSIQSLTFQRDNARRQRNTAWAITGGIILGAGTVIVVAVSP